VGHHFVDAHKVMLMMPTVLPYGNRVKRMKRGIFMRFDKVDDFSLQAFYIEKCRYGLGWTTAIAGAWTATGV